MSRRYLTEFIRFGLGEEEKQAVRMFAQLLRKHGVIEAVREFSEPCWI